VQEPRQTQAQTHTDTEKKKKKKKTVELGVMMAFVLSLHRLFLHRQVLSALRF
jgi:hypothetical protein